MDCIMCHIVREEKSCLQCVLRFILIPMLSTGEHHVFGCIKRYGESISPIIQRLVARYLNLGFSLRVRH